MNKGGTAGMNLKEVYEIFYPGKCKENPSVWNVPPKYRSKKDFFEELLPMEIRWINFKFWNDKARRSRFFRIVKEKPDILHHYAHFYLNNHGLSRG